MSGAREGCEWCCEGVSGAVRVSGACEGEWCCEGVSGLRGYEGVSGAVRVWVVHVRV